MDVTEPDPNLDLISHQVLTGLCPAFGAGQVLCTCFCPSL